MRSAVTGVAADTIQRPVSGERYGGVKTTVPAGAARAGAKNGSSAWPAESCHCGDALPSTTRAISSPLWSTNATTPAKPWPILPMRSSVASRRLRPSVVRGALYHSSNPELVARKRATTPALSNCLPSAWLDVSTLRWRARSTRLSSRECAVTASATPPTSAAMPATRAPRGSAR